MASALRAVESAPVRFYEAVVPAALVLAALSLLAPSTPTYDPWAWLVWGRELAALELDTTAGPAWKPLPVLVTALLTPLGDAAPDAWLVLARAAGLVAVALVARLACRAAAGRAPLLAAVVAAASFVLAAGVARSVALGSSEGLLVAFGAAAFDRHLDGARRQALLLAVGAALLRPEVWPLLAAYGIWLLRRGEEHRLLAAAAIVVPVLWFVPELWGSGDLLRSSERARVPNPGAPTLADYPALEVVRRFALMLPPLAAGAVLARGSPARRVAVGAAAWVGVVAALSELGYSGEERYLIPAAAAVAALAGAGWARAASAHRSVAAVLAVAALAPLPAAYQAARSLARDLADDAALRVGLADTVAAAGGAGAVRCGAIAAGRYRFPLVAWHLDVPISRIHLAAGERGAVLRSRLRRGWPLEPEAPSAPFALVATAGGWEAWSTCA